MTYENIIPGTHMHNKTHVVSTNFVHDIKNFFIFSFVK